MEGEDSQLVGKHNLDDACVTREVCAWLAVVANRVSFEDCMQSAVETLPKGFQPASFGCTTCCTIHLDSHNFA